MIQVSVVVGLLHVAIPVKLGKCSDSISSLCGYFFKRQNCCGPSVNLEVFPWNKVELINHLI